jgi:predicted transcriptional regulator
MKTLGKMDKSEIGERQQMIMQCVWDAADRVTIQDIIDRMEVKCGVRFSKSSINTLVLMLVDRGFLVQDRKIHQAYTFRAVISEEEFRLREIKRFGKFTFGDSPSVMLETLMKTDVSEDEYNKMKEILDNYHG